MMIIVETHDCPNQTVAFVTILGLHHVPIEQDLSRVCSDMLACLPRLRYACLSA